MVTFHSYVSLPEGSFYVDLYESLEPADKNMLSINHPIPEVPVLLHHN